MATATRIQTEKLERKVAALSKEVARLRSIVDWGKALEDVPYEEEDLRPAFVRRLARQAQRIRSGKEPLYQYDPETFGVRLAKSRTKSR